MLNQGPHLINGDRLTPRRPHSHGERCSPPSYSPAQGKARAIVKKYRKHVRNIEFKKLKSVVPSISENQKVSQTEILEETIRYIDSLHQKLLERIQTDGIPDQLKEKVPLKQLNSMNGNELTKSQLSSLMKNAFQEQFSLNLSKKKKMDSDILKRLLQKESPREDSSRSQLLSPPICNNNSSTTNTSALNYHNLKSATLKYI
ncbi:unnamed protein product [Lepeophtheirus salmonis]|uniref:(salmon louse) hypothetical protein n=1 Tax=Lepeophtheirus salmonis TaxID=72036 RepID=A0A7R8HBT1_LEPSM|nr:unnamed protein product [Lepeophtheirus salmonis]CAF2987246.1 unnamed protein product [Lepeophtheirus salmonis]